MKIKIILAGATGWVGKALSAAICASQEMELVGAIAPEYARQNLGTILQIPDLNITIARSVEEALENASDAHVFIDFTKPDVVKKNVLTALEYGKQVVIGTSGLQEQDFKEIARVADAKGIGVIAAGNFSLTAALMKHFSLQAAQLISQWEIIDYASATKPDAPSGTARELAAAIASVRNPEIQVPIEKTFGEQEARGASIAGTQVHSIRLPSYSVSTEIIFGIPDEKLIIRHDAGSGAQPYVAGVLLAVRKLKSTTGLVRGLDKILSI